MNSLNILSGISSTPPPSPPRSRAASLSDQTKSENRSRSRGRKPSHDVQAHALGEKIGAGDGEEDKLGNGQDAPVDGKTALLGDKKPEAVGDAKDSSGWYFPKRMASALTGALRVVLAVVFAPATYLISCFYDDDGRFSIIMPLYRVARKMPRRKRRHTTRRRDSGAEDSRLDAADERVRRKTSSQKPQKRSPSVSSISSSGSVAMTSDSESERPPTRDGELDSPSRNTRSKSSASGDEIAPARRSIRIKLHTEEALKRKGRKGRTSSAASAKPSGSEQHLSPHEAAAAALKSPTSPGAASKLKFPRAPAPPRPLVPRRQPSYAPNAAMSFGPHPKTLILDLDETLIHSMAKGGRYTTGHMVEVKLSQPVGAGGATYGGPQVPILYYVHKRPYCDEFLRKVSRWYNLIVFTASVQEYADPVIDWLELERKYFAGRYYRQHCTFRNGAYIKDLSQVEPDLSKVMIVDNSPMSYIFHEDNAIPIEGWISDPTDNDLLHLIPLLEGLQHVTDLRALLALRLGEPAAS
ncbi:uncharacterized protein K452DRAFT_226673 [Aplosporella prunicola CBS 121167]|uniref:FCP1 homology domain-containing protein n=1 Tax=Aplosporella prunicola CBS 121167 TaxID=1176127 RepID=A0A6A6BIA6_9PEZI|nr:uncharacterized protein K452DRAFT_226673 [Aplosporella prunicola CBS 121167]KAF2142577.1 hypothetical protein K452DRAFT_226673 [Aplosporella prunicola CBS 121167]